MPVIFVYDDVALPSTGAIVTAMTSEDPEFPKANGIGPDRMRITRTIVGPAGTVHWDCDLGVAKPVYGFALCNVVSDAPAGAKPIVELKTGNTSSAAATIKATTTTGARWDTEPDWVGAISSVTDRYIRLTFTTGGYRFSFGKLILGKSKDFTHIYDKGGEFTWWTPGNRVRTIGQDPVDNRLGKPRKLYRYPYTVATDIDRQVCEAIAKQAYPFAILDSTGGSSHVIHKDPREVRFPHVHDTIWGADFAFEQMP